MGEYDLKKRTKAFAFYWMELLVESDLVRRELLDNRINEADELVAIVVSSIKTAKQNKSK